MMIRFPYSDIAAVEIPDSNLLGVFAPEEHPALDELGLAASSALHSPTASSRLSRLAREKSKVTVVCDDYTRQTPLRTLFPLLVPELVSAGVRPWDVRILVALGTHRPMTEQERLDRLGPEICRAFEVVDHDWRDENNLVDVGKTRSGIVVRINRLAAEADLVIGLGQIAPHRIAGYSGGSKIILPGTAGREATAYTHWTGGKLPGEQVLGVRDNPVRREMDEAGKLAGLAFIVNAVCDPAGRVIEIVAGDPIEAHRKGCKTAEKVFGVRIREPADIVIVDSFPKDIELWQAAKALYAAELMVKPGGVVILVTPCPEGVSKSHPLILERGYKGEAETLEEVACGDLTDLMTASHCLRVGRLIKDKATGILVSPGIGKEDAEHLGFIYAATPQEALEIAFGLAGRGAKVSVLRNGGEALPVIGKEF